MTSPPDALVLGAGLIGLSCARELRSQGARVLVVDAGPARRRASLAAAGLLAPLSHSLEPGPLAEACFRSRSLWPEWRAAILAESGEPIEVDDSGAFVVAADDSQEETLEGVLAMAKRLGEPSKEVDPAEVLRQVPDLRTDIRRAVHLPGESRVDNVQAVAALEKACDLAGVERRSGVTALEITTGDDEVKVATSDGTFRSAAAVMAVGAWSGTIDGVRPVEVRPVRGQMLRHTDASWPWRGMLRIGNHYAVRRGDAGVLFGATVEEAGFDDRTTAEGIGILTGAFGAAFPRFADRDPARTWSGLRPATADGFPLVGPWRDSRLFLATGHHRDGVLLAPWTAECCRHWWIDRTWRPDPAFCADRFAEPSA